MDDTKQIKQMTFTDRLRKIASSVTKPLGKLLHQSGLSPDIVTVFGLFLVGVASWRISEGAWTQAAIILIIALPMDTLDGAIARAGGKFRPVGSFLDSTLDRYADALIIGGVGLYYTQQDDALMMVVSIVALHGALMVSYVRAKAESLNIDCKIGLFTRVERLLTILFAWIASLFIGQAGIDMGIIVLAVGTQFTSLQRMLYVMGQLRLQTDTTQQSND